MRAVLSDPFSGGCTGATYVQFAEGATGFKGTSSDAPGGDAIRSSELHAPDNQGSAASTVSKSYINGRK